jgi:hypothetical protein BACCOPRO_00693
MKKLLSLPQNLVDSFHDITNNPRDEWFCTSDPVDQKLGSGGGTAWLLKQAYKAETDRCEDFEKWLGREKRLLLHAGGQSRRLPAYAPSGKILTPIPVFRWGIGQRLSQDLLSLQIPLYQRIMETAPDSLHTMIVSGDVLIRATEQLETIPEVDVVCYGLWLGPEIAKNHGVFVSRRDSPDRLECMLQKPKIEQLGQLQKSHYYLTDIGVWILSDKAVSLLIEQSSLGNGEMREYDLYGTFGCCLGDSPSQVDKEISALTVAILPLPGGEFYHFGTSHELLSSTVAIQNLVNDQRRIMHHSLKPQPSIFVQNSLTKIRFTDQNENIWVENSCIGNRWKITRNNILTGIPHNDWRVELVPGQCIDIVPIDDEAYALREYKYNDTFAGHEQFAPIFPVFPNFEKLDLYMSRGRKKAREYISAEQISVRANLKRLFAQRKSFRELNWQTLAANYEHSVFYQLDLADAARAFRESNLPMPVPISVDAPLMNRIGDAMFRSEISSGKEAQKYESRAFELLADALTSATLTTPQFPVKAVYDDQIVWGRSPVRIDLAGGWTDTPPHCLIEGGNVINMAIELNGQPPIQTYIKTSEAPVITLRSIDLGAIETVRTYTELSQFNKVGSPFSIPKAALALAGFMPYYCAEDFGSLKQQLEHFGGGIEITLLSAIPAGSGLGTSSILSATVLSALSDFCKLGWDKNEIGRRTLMLEQLLTTGGGWQDQFGGLFGGVKLLQTQPGLNQSPSTRWMPANLFTHPDYKPCHLLYYTGITRTAKTILSEIVRRMFLNEHDELELLREMKIHALNMYDTILRGNFISLGQLVRRTWQQNQKLDSGTNPSEVSFLTQLVDDLCLGYKLPGAGGGGYLYMIAKDPDAALRIRKTLTAESPNPNSRFVEMSLSESGTTVSRS